MIEKIWSFQLHRIFFSTYDQLSDRYILGKGFDVSYSKRLEHEKLYCYNVDIYEKIKDICAPLNHLGISSFFYERFFFDGRFFSIGNNLNWISYSLNHFSQDSPLFSTAAMAIPTNKMQGVLWPQDKMDDKFQALLSFGLWHGLSFYKKHEDFIDCWEFSTSVENDFVYGVYGDKRGCLEAFIRYFNLKIADFISVEKDIPIAHFDVNLYAQQPLVSDSSVTDFLKEINYQAFSKREQECLMCIQKGKSAKEIARILDLSPRTVEFYIQNMKKKAGVSKITGLYDFMSI